MPSQQGSTTESKYLLSIPDEVNPFLGYELENLLKIPVDVDAEIRSQIYGL